MYFDTLRIRHIVMYCETRRSAMELSRSHGISPPTPPTLEMRWRPLSPRLITGSHFCARSSNFTTPPLESDTPSQ